MGWVIDNQTGVIGKQKTVLQLGIIQNVLVLVNNRQPPCLVHGYTLDGYDLVEYPHESKNNNHI